MILIYKIENEKLIGYTARLSVKTLSHRLATAILCVLHVLMTGKSNYSLKKLSQAFSSTF